MRVRVVPAAGRDFDRRVLRLLGEDAYQLRPSRRRPPPEGTEPERRWYAVDDAYFREGVDVRAEPGMTAADLLDAVVPAMYAAELSWLSPEVAGPVLARFRAARREPWAGHLAGCRNGVPLPGGERVLTGLDLLDEQGEVLRYSATVAELGLADGDTLQFSLTWEPPEDPDRPDHLMAGAPTPEHMTAMLQVAAATPYGPATPRLWGVLLYTEADTGIATYIRTHFDELNALTGPTLGIMVLERPAKWSTVRRYWRQTLDPPLFRVFSAMRWLAWQPYDRHRSHDIARDLGIPPDQLPCLALFRATEPRDRLVFPLAEATPAYFRRLFGAISEAIGPDGPPAPERPRLRMWRRQDAFSRHPDPDPDTAAQDAVASVRALTGTPTDPAHRAFARVRAAEERILAALRPVPEPDRDREQDRDQNQDRRYELHGHNVLFIRHEGGSVADQFTFHGQTTFINRPVDTVVRDFQNTHATVPYQEHLTRLLHAVLASGLPDADRERAARTITEAGDSLAAPEPDRAAARSGLESLRAVLTGTAGVAQPALEILNGLLPLLTG